MTRDEAIEEAARVLRAAEAVELYEKRRSLLDVAEGWCRLADALAEPLDAFPEPAPNITVHVAGEAKDSIPELVKELQARIGTSARRNGIV